MPISWPHPVELFASPQDSPLKRYIGHYNDDGDKPRPRPRLTCGGDCEKNMIYHDFDNQNYDDNADHDIDENESTP